MSYKCIVKTKMVEVTFHMPKFLKDNDYLVAWKQAVNAMNEKIVSFKVMTEDTVFEIKETNKNKICRMMTGMCDKVLSDLRAADMD